MHKSKLSPSTRLLPICAAIVLSVVTFNREARSQTPTIAGTYSGTIYPGSNTSDPNPDGPLAASVTLNLDGTLANIYIQDLLETFDPSAVQRLQVTDDQDAFGNIIDEALSFDYTRSSAGPEGWGSSQWTYFDVYGAQYDFFAGTWSRTIWLNYALGQSVGFDRDAAGRLISVTDGRGKAQTFQVDGLGHSINAFDAYARPAAQNYYDSRELLEETTDGMGRINDWDYDERGALIQYTDGLSKATTFTSDALKRLTTATSPLSEVTAQSFDLEGNRVSLTNALANPTAFSFDLGDRLSSVTTANGLLTQYTYNSRNLLETVTRPSGQKTTNTYDAALRLCKVSAVQGTGQISRLVKYRGSEAQTLSGDPDQTDEPIPFQHMLTAAEKPVIDI